MSHPTRGAWIETAKFHKYQFNPESRTPHGVRGLKQAVIASISTPPSRRTPHGVRGLKQKMLADEQQTCTSRTPHGVRGLKLKRLIESGRLLSRTPHGVRGLKHLVKGSVFRDDESPPTRGAWIETDYP